MIHRRDFLKATLPAGLGCMILPPRTSQAAARRPRHILLSNGWHTVNIGDIAHTPGMLHLIETYLPDTRVTFWPYKNLDKPVQGIRQMLLNAFPSLTIIGDGGYDGSGRPVSTDLVEAFSSADLFICGSGGIHERPIRIWRDATHKPYGIYGNSFGSIDPTNSETVRDSVRLYSGSRFIYCRDTISLDNLKRAGVESPELAFGPDSTFALHLRDDARADAWLAAKGLEPGKFVCAIPHTRYTPHFAIYGVAPDATNLRHAKVNAEFKAVDNAKLRDCMVRFVRATGLKVLACPEMTYHVELAKETLVDPLPDDVKPYVVWRDSFWLCDEAASVYARALAVVSFDCHSPIIALANGTPAIHVRLPTDNHKSRMYADIGLGDWKWELDDVDGEKLANMLLEIHTDRAAARKKVAMGMEFVRQRQQVSMAIVGAALPASA